MTAKPDVGTVTFSDLVYADDTALYAKSAERATVCLSSFQRSFCMLPIYTVVNYVILASVYTRTNSSYRTVQPLATSKMRTADLQNVQ